MSQHAPTRLVPGDAVRPVDDLLDGDRPTIDLPDSEAHRRRRRVARVFEKHGMNLLDPANRATWIQERAFALDVLDALETR